MFVDLSIFEKQWYMVTFLLKRTIIALSIQILVLTFPVPIPGRREKIFIFIFTLLCGASKGFMKA